MAKNLDDITGKKSRAPQWEPNWGRILQGQPNKTEHLDPQRVQELSQPLPMPRNVKEWTPDPGTTYPGGPWERRTDSAGVTRWWHLEAHRRAQLPQFLELTDG